MDVWQQYNILLYWYHIMPTLFYLTSISYTGSATEFLNSHTMLVNGSKVIHIFLP